MSMSADFAPGLKESFMSRAVALAYCGRGAVSPNPMVGAVLVAPDGTVIGEGFHRAYGGPHAEVNAIASVGDEALLQDATMFVTLEPCSHYGKTPPCAELIINKRIPRVVVGSPDPFPSVSGRGIAMLREAGIEVETDFMRELTDSVNPMFLTSHRLGRPYILLKWAQSADGYIAGGTPESPVRAQLSSPLTSVMMHKCRADVDAIMVGTNTANIDDPRLDVRLWPGRSPRPVTFDRTGRLDKARKIVANPRSVIFKGDITVGEAMRSLYADHGVTSVMVEGGAQLLNTLIETGLWDEARIETAPVILGGGIPAPRISGIETSCTGYRGYVIRHIKSRS